MAPSDPEVIVDQVGNLSAAKETVLLLGSSRLILLLNWELWMILFNAEAILASNTSKFGIEIPRVVDEDLNSSTFFFFVRTELMKASKRHKCRRQKRSAKNDNEGSLARTC